MKKILLVSMALCIGSFAFSQKSIPKITCALKDVGIERPINLTIDNSVNLKSNENPYVAPKGGTKAPSENQIGETFYDLQTNSAVQNRIYRFGDGTIGGTWTRGMQNTTGFPDRGTGYNYYNGTSWGSYPNAKLESMKTGWPSYAALGSGGEIIVSHTGTHTGLVISTRATKGTGNWTETTFEGPIDPLAGDSAHSILWPRMVTHGNTIHMIYVTAPEANGGNKYKGLDGALLYSRSTDGGVNWDKQHVSLPGMDSSLYIGFSGDNYAFAEPKGDTIAFVIGSEWYDFFLMKSVDAGNTWTKKMIFQHPYPKWTDSIVTIDTPFVCDASMAIALDNSGDAHVFFGIMRVCNSTAGDNSTTWYPTTDGLIYWNESMSAFPTLRPDTLTNQGHMVGHMIDCNGDGQILIKTPNPPDWTFGLYYHSLSSYPSVAIDENDDIYLTFSAILEIPYNDGSQHYRHIHGTKSLDGGATWSPITIVTDTVVHKYDECVFASQAANTDNNIHLVYQSDYAPGLAIKGDEDPFDNNAIIYLKIPKIEIGNDSTNSITENNVIVSKCNIYPNPATDKTWLTLGLNKSETLNISIYNLMGQKVYEESKGKIRAGAYQFSVDVSDLNSGIYFYSVKAGEQIVTKKLIVE